MIRFNFHFYVFAVLSAAPISSEQKLDKEKSVAGSKEDYDESPAVEKLPEEAASTSETALPLVFPSDTKPSKNDTALEILQKNSAGAIEVKNVVFFLYTIITVIIYDVREIICMKVDHIAI